MNPAGVCRLGPVPLHPSLQQPTWTSAAAQPSVGSAFHPTHASHQPKSPAADVNAYSQSLAGFRACMGDSLRRRCHASLVQAAHALLDKRLLSCTLIHAVSMATLGNCLPLMILASHKPPLLGHLVCCGLHLRFGLFQGACYHQYGPMMPLQTFHT